MVSASAGPAGVAGVSCSLNGAPALSAPSLFDRGNAHLAPPASHFAGAAINPAPLQVIYLKTKAADTPLLVAGDTPGLLQDYTPGLQRYIVAPSLSRMFSSTAS